MNLPVISHGIAALAFCGAFLGLPRGTPRAVRAAFLASALWATALAVSFAGVSLPRGLNLSLVALRYGAWFLALFSLQVLPVAVALRRTLIAGAGGLFLLAWVLPLLPDPDTLLTRWLGLGGLVLSFGGLVLLEQILRNASPASARAVKLLTIGLGSQFAFDLFLYSQTALLTSVDDQARAVRGLVDALLQPLVVLGLRRLQTEQPGVFISRQVVFYTTAFLAVGVYLVVMALGGYYVRDYGGTWGESLRLLFMAGAGVVLATLLLSNATWRRLRVFIAKHFYRNKYDYRVEWLRFIRTVSEQDDQSDTARNIHAIAQILGSPAGMLFERTDTGSGFRATSRWVESGAALDYPPDVNADSEFARFLAEREWVIDLTEFRVWPDRYQNVMLPEWLLKRDIGWRLVVPLLGPTGLEGFLLLSSPPEPFQMTFEDRDLLKTVGRHVATLLAQQAADRKLTESRQFDAFNRFAAFVMHDLKNSVAQLQLLVNNAARHRHNPEFVDDAIDTIANTAQRMTGLIEQLQAREARSDVRPVNLARLLGEAADRGCARQPEVCVAPGPEEASIEADAERLGAVLDHVIRNAQEAVGPRGPAITLSLALEGAQARIAITDEGPGMDPDFVRDRLFRPFDSTKGSKGMGIGAYQARDYVQRLGGGITVETRPGQGTTFLIRLPLCQKQNPES
jgi:putative PEP-CTERM system histidine kinase